VVKHVRFYLLTTVHAARVIRFMNERLKRSVYYSSNSQMPAQCWHA